jgi:hypothetical protein
MIMEFAVRMTGAAEYTVTKLLLEIAGLLDLSGGSD